ncbi:peptide/nickel transport system permease protein [Thermocatellispora tengchongensis]|uniref:Peptide/nickel transport system permease protein n=1 Tax=Thermocatellispora tengchongensis TaxID=1073253 RepID=A0A840PH27_9ACTN|nr:ABC transporter permease [Thermocatellispora tengchongensis]MBB5138136.1 peptide/nickel transport system permease protein [Thermocatellispora tengchongensis]
MAAIALRLSRPRPGVTAAALFLALLAVAVAAPGLLAGADPLAADPLRALEPPGPGHWLGTDHLGRDVLARVVHGARHSLTIGVLATALAVACGLVLGLAAGLSHRWVDEALARSFDVLGTLPELLLALLVVAITGPGTGSVVLAIGIAQIPHFARLVRAQTFVVRRAGYVEQAVTFGFSRAAITFRHVLPNVLGPLPVLATIALGSAVIAASGLSFLGMGPQPPAPEWGAMLSEARNYMRVAWWEALAPGAAVTLTVVCLTVTGRHLQHRFEGRTP